MDSRIGLDCIVENAHYTEKLAKALDCDSVAVKKQVFELLSTLCVYNSEGYFRALQVLQAYKETKSERYRLKLVVDELANVENPLHYKTVLVAFVNCLIISTPQLKDRIRIRNEFVGLKLLGILAELRKVATNEKAADLLLQLDVFHEQRENDDNQLLESPNGVDLNSHVDVFYAILRQVAETPQEIPFLSILQHLLRIDPKEAISDIIWDTAETLVYRATLLESKQDATRILRSSSIQNRLCCHSHRSFPDTIHGASRKQSQPAIASTSIQATPNTTETTTTADSSIASVLSSSLPPPPPPLSPMSLQPPPPPPPPPPPSTSPYSSLHAQEINYNQIQNETKSSIVAPSPPPPPPPPSLVTQTENKGSSVESSFQPSSTTNFIIPRLPQQETPMPKTKMKTVNWNKITNDKVVGKHNIWSAVATSHQHSPMPDLDWREMENLFCQQLPPPPPPSPHSGGGLSSPKLGRYDSNDSSYERRRKEPSEIILLDGRRSLNVNIFLKQFRCSNDNIIQMIRDGEHDDIGAEKLKGLLKMLPESDELEMLQAFDGDESRLANAEKFLKKLIRVPHYKLRIECMLLKEEFASNMSYIEPSINAMMVAGEDLTRNEALQEVLYTMICAGNFLNSGGYAGNAAGVKLTSLQKLTDIRANKPGMNLMHYVAMRVEKKRADLTRFVDDMSAVLDDARKTSVEQLVNEVQTLDDRIRKIFKEIELPTTEADIKNQMTDFLKMAQREVDALKQDLRALEGLRRSLAEFFCEDTTTFKIEECFKIFYTFCAKFKRALIENERRRIQEQQVSARKKQREEQIIAAARKKMGVAGSGYGENISISEDEMSQDCQNIMNLLTNDTVQLINQQKRLSDKDLKNRKATAVVDEKPYSYSVTNSPVVNRRRLGSFSGGESPYFGSAKEETYSPDITPTGSLRRRKSRAPSEEDELMDFLKSGAIAGVSEDETLKERKCWGSLDRSWARRARGSKKRPDLLNADFSSDRERNTTSPASSFIENKTCSSPTTPMLEQEVRPKAWRQKIETWLRESEKERSESMDVPVSRKAMMPTNSSATRRHYHNRRSLENDSGNEGKAFYADSSRASGEYENKANSLEIKSSERMANQQQQSHRGYSDWKSSTDTTDGAKTIESIAAVSLPQRHEPSEKQEPNIANETSLNSSGSGNGWNWRDSDVAAAATDVRQLRRIKSKGSADSSSPLEAIEEEERKRAKNRLHGGSSNENTELQAYGKRWARSNDDTSIRKTEYNACDRYRNGGVGGGGGGSSSSSVDQSSPLPPFSPRKYGSYKKQPDEPGRIDKIEIDSDNIETPPAVRKRLGAGAYRELTSENSGSYLSPSSSFHRRSKGGTVNVAVGQREEILGDGQFDRFASARRTRRYGKKSPHDDEYAVKNDSLTTRVAGAGGNCYEMASAALRQREDAASTAASEEEDDEYRNQNDRRLKSKSAVTTAIDDSITISTTPANTITTTVTNSNSVINSSTSSSNNMGSDTYNNATTDINAVSLVSGERREKETMVASRNRIPVLRSNYMRNNQRATWASSTLPRSYKTTPPTSGSPIVRNLTGDRGDNVHNLEMGKERCSSIDSTTTKTTRMKNSSAVQNIGSPPASAPIVVFDESGDASQQPNDKIERPRKMISLLPKRINGMAIGTTTVDSSSRPPPIATVYSHTLPRSSTASKGGSGSFPNSLTTNRGLADTTKPQIKSNPKLESYTKVIKSLASNLHKSTNKITPKKTTSVLPIKSKSKQNGSSSSVLATASRSSSSASSNGGGSQPPQQRKLSYTNYYKEDVADPVTHFRIISTPSSQNFMKPTASSSAKDQQTDVKPKIVVRTPFK